MEREYEDDEEAEYAEYVEEEIPIGGGAVLLPALPEHDDDPEPPKKNNRPPNAGKGRPKGSVNRTSKQVEWNMLKVFAAIGGVEMMADWARENLTAYYQLYAKMLPKQMHAILELPGLVELPTEHELSGRLVEHLKHRAPPTDPSVH